VWVARGWPWSVLRELWSYVEIDRADAVAAARAAGRYDRIADPLLVEHPTRAAVLRHSFAVTTLEHLQRGHLRALGALNPEQRRHYQMVFGDPLDWVRRRLPPSPASPTTSAAPSPR